MIKPFLSLFSRDNRYNLYSRILSLFRDPQKGERRIIQKYRTQPLPKDRQLKFFFVVKNVNWEHSGLVQTWKGMVEEYHFSWKTEYDQKSPEWWSSQRKLFNQDLVAQVSKARHEHGIDVVFSYLSGSYLDAETLISLKNLGITLVNVSFDDSHAFWGAKRAGVFRGQAELCCHFDINITLQRREDVFKYEMTGGDAIFLYPGGNQLLWGNMEMRAKRDIPISFIGKKYGRRGEIVDYILENNIPITTGGIGFGKPLSQEEMKNVYGRSLMTLGVGYNGNTKKTALKGRDFEVPLTGCAYLTTFNRELASCFEEGKEILFYHNKKDLVKKIQYYRNREEECVEIGRRGQTKAQNQHTWGKRWEYLLQILTGKVIFD